jgi:hypothetical protein
MEEPGQAAGFMSVQQDVTRAWPGDVHTFAATFAAAVTEHA